ncbi:hypothetical protein AB0L05_36440 [Nonomuraea pusilla]|uniref:hypothetical protein n=1 Tax=Nonomuraea pusilla TaxID=46177 RepID=UPI00332B7033
MASVTPLLVSLSLGLAAVAGFRRIMRWPVRSWWLLAALVCPAVRFVAIAVG